MARIRINQVSYFGEKYTYQSPTLKDGLNIIEGPNRTGKSTFMNLIYYALSGSVPEFKKDGNNDHFEITNDHNNYVLLDLSIDSEVFKLQRFIGQNDIIVSDAEKNSDVYAIHRSKNEKYIFSDWLLEKLSIVPVEVFQGAQSFKINFRDLVRLIYHDQELDPRKVYKRQDYDNIISDSETVRKVIFQLLLGKSFNEYYESLAKQKELEKSKQVRKGLLEEYTLISKTLQSGTEEMNLTFIQQRMSEKQQQLEKLSKHRESVQIDRPQPAERLKDIEMLKADLLERELEVNSLNEELSSYAEEASKLQKLKENTILESTQIHKIIHVHENLNLFSANTCPYCLREVEREEGHCVCGSSIDEKEYERFFYNSSEYADILKAKKKNIETIDSALRSIKDEVEEVKRIKDSTSNDISSLKREIQEIVVSVDRNFDVATINALDDQILKVREELSKLEQKAEIEKKLEELQTRYDAVDAQLKIVRAETARLQIDAELEIQKRIKEFNAIYNPYLTSTLKECRTAKIDDSDYMPVINNGEYREASSSVPIRFMYFLTMLYLSLTSDEIKFPRLLLIDTPETAGIDHDNLMKCMTQIETLNSISNDYQIIMSTAVGKYPSEFKDRVFASLDDNDKLLEQVNPKK
ncbi:AAA family ATPase [Roseivirga pacifica]